MTPRPVRTLPRFLEGPAGPLFSLILQPEGAPGAQAALYLPAFGEEMNRTRRLAALLGRALAARGCTAVILDPFGTGDSAGDFAEARWETWRADAAAALAWLAAQGHTSLSLIGLRAGANLALEVAAEADGPPARVVLWQPLLSGRLFLNQLLRIRVASGLGTAPGAAGGEAKESTRDLRARLAAGETLEVAGYPITPAMADSLEGLELVAPALRCMAPLHWLEVAGDAAAEPAPATAKALSALEAGGRAVDYRRIAGEAFWSIEEPVLIEDLIEQTVAMVCGGDR